MKKIIFFYEKYNCYIKNSHNLNHIKINHYKKITNCINKKNPNKIILYFNHFKISNNL